MERVTACLVGRGDRWYSPGFAAAEVAVVSRLAAEAESDHAEAETDGLGSDQVAAVETILGANTNGVLVVGPASVGKTEMLGRVAAPVGHDRVLAIAPTAEAAANLGSVLPIEYARPNANIEYNARYP